MTDGLFRKEVFNRTPLSNSGGISLAQPVRMWILTAFASTAALLICGVLYFGEYTARYRATGQLVPDLGLVTVTSPGDGVIEQVFVKEGELVNDGTSLIAIKDPRATSLGNDLSFAVQGEIALQRASIEKIQSAEIAQVDAQISGFRQQVELARKELSQIREEIDTRGEQLQLSRSALERFESLAGDDYITEVQLTEQRQTVLDQLGVLQALKRQAIGLERTIVEIERNLKELPARRAALIATKSLEVAQLDWQTLIDKAGGNFLMKAPLAGIVAGRLVEAGQAVRSGETLFTLLPKGSELQAQFLVPSNSIGFIEPGDRVIMRYRAFPYQKFGHHLGTVIRISRSPVSSTGATSTSIGATPTVRYFRVLVALESQTILAYGEQEILLPGMAVEADILGETRKLYEWVLEPLYSLRGIFNNQQS